MDFHQSRPGAGARLAPLVQESDACAESGRAGASWIQLLEEIWLQIQRPAITNTVYNCRPKEGKKRMRQFGKVEIPQSAFIAALKMGDG